ncbi:MAG: hypothetical protein GXO26_05930, partial [Crenarchaeota archaeon]|nr:hypothetical protein [Thermoproteota archaeon]
MIRVLLEEYAGVIALAIAIVLTGSVIGYALYTINNVGIMNVRYAMLLPWAYAYYNGTKIVLWVTNPGLISFTVKKVVADNGLILLNHPVGPIAPNGYIVLKFPYVKIRRVISARIYRLTLCITFRGDNDVTDRVVVLAESYYGTNRIEKIVKVVKTEGYVHYIQNSTNIVTLFFEDCSHCDFDYRDLILTVENIGQRLVLVQEHEKGGYPHWLYINGTLVNYKPPGATQQGKTWIYNLKLVQTKYTTRRVVLYSPHWITIVACVSGHICKQFTTPIWNITIITQVINQTTNITSKKLSWYVPHTYTPPGYATIYISITPPTTPTWTYIKIQTPTGIAKTYLLCTKYAKLKTKCIIGECYPSGCDKFCAPWSNNAPGYYAIVYSPSEIIEQSYITGYYWWIVNDSNVIPINNSVPIITTGTLTLIVPIGTKISIYVPKEVQGWEVLSKPYKIPISYYYAITNIKGIIVAYLENPGRGAYETKQEKIPKTFTEWTFLGYLGPLINGLVHKNKITITVNKSGYILVVYAPNPNTVNIKIRTNITNIP